MLKADNTEYFKIPEAHRPVFKAGVWYESKAPFSDGYCVVDEAGVLWELRWQRCFHGGRYLELFKDHKSVHGGHVKPESAYVYGAPKFNRDELDSETLNVRVPRDDNPKWSTLHALSGFDVQHIMRRMAEEAA